MVEVKIVTVTVRNNRKVSLKIKMELPYDLAISPGHLCEGKKKHNKSLTQEVICTPMFTSALLTVVRTWKQPKFSPLMTGKRSRECLAVYSA